MLLTKLIGMKFELRLLGTFMLTCILLSCLLYFLNAPEVIVVFAISLGAGFPGIYCSLKIMRQRWKTLTSVLKGFTVTLFLFGLHTTDYAFVFRNAEVVTVGFTFAMLLVVALTVFAPAAILEKLEREKTELEMTLKYRAQLIHTSKLTALGEMAGGMAHEINNPLQLLIGFTTLMKKAIKKGKVDQEFLLSRLDKIENTTERISKIVSGLIQFSREGNSKLLVPEKVSKIIEDALRLCRETFEREGIWLEVEQEDEDLEVICQRIEIQQVIINLLNNSKDALSRLEEKWIKIFVKDEKDIVKISVIDSGHGIPKDIVDKIFQPFYTTKDIGKGTGLGLSVSKGMIESQGGKLGYGLRNGHTVFSFTLTRNPPGKNIIFPVRTALSQEQQHWPESGHQ